MGNKKISKVASFFWVIFLQYVVTVKQLINTALLLRLFLFFFVCFFLFLKIFQANQEIRQKLIKLQEISCPNIDTSDNQGLFAKWMNITS